MSDKIKSFINLILEILQWAIMLLLLTSVAVFLSMKAYLSACLFMVVVILACPLTKKKLRKEGKRIRKKILIPAIVVPLLAGFIAIPVPSVNQSGVQTQTTEVVEEYAENLSESEEELQPELASVELEDDSGIPIEIETQSDEQEIPCEVLPEDSTFWIEYIDVGQGDAALIQCDGHYMLIDGGDNKKSSLIYTVLKNNGVQNLDYIIATHPDADHIGGISGALNYAKVATCYCPVTIHDTETFNNMIKYLDKQERNITVPKAGEEFSLGSAKVTLLGPVIKGSESNNDSIVAMIQYGSNRFLFTGDAEEEEELSVLAKWQDIKCDVLKVGHHGSSSSTSNMFLTACRPEYAIISVGRDNSYGHPTQEIIDKLCSINTTIYRTDLHGDITVTSDGQNLQFTCEKKTDEELLKSAPAKENGNRTGIIEENTNLVEDVPVSPETSYVLNNNTGKFHYPSCSSVGDISPKNRQDTTLSRDEIVAQGYVPCKRCNP